METSAYLIGNANPSTSDSCHEQILIISPFDLYFASYRNVPSCAIVTLQEQNKLWPISVNMVHG